MKAIERQIAEIDTYTDCDDGHVFRTWRDTMQALLDVARAADEMKRDYEQYGYVRNKGYVQPLHDEIILRNYETALNKLKEVCPDE